MIIDDYDSRFERLLGQRVDALKRVVGAVPVEEDDGKLLHVINFTLFIGWPLECIYYGIIVRRYESRKHYWQA